jgi:hypothetical protein
MSRWAADCSRALSVITSRARLGLGRIAGKHAGHDNRPPVRSGLTAIVTLAKSIINRLIDVAVAGGVESISLVRNENVNRYRTVDPKLREQYRRIICR